MSILHDGVSEDEVCDGSRAAPQQLSRNAAELTFGRLDRNPLALGWGAASPGGLACDGSLTAAGAVSAHDLELEGSGPTGSLSALAQRVLDLEAAMQRRSI